MAFSSGGGGASMAEINVTPLIDVLLVLLIIFIVTAPAMTMKIPIDLPQKSVNPPPPAEDPPPPISVRIDGAGQVYLNNNPVATNQVQNNLLTLVPAAMQDGQTVEPADQPTLELEVNPEADYETLTVVLSSAKNIGMEKIAFRDNM
ncbi:ExbD/TolR family protein [Coralloluteibacterium stylophorae]|uniref:Biopolymer transporter ExbD n=1 Tax=Coralloluteibacterium stylophorae TaxID=1776034 RepID=A0A8J7VSA9_9GAMM|nr:biopolymer transporter ExbD [Coralloluteibacterium stylophorae]MBS7458949.1 biopolymer transporter ExbD [Coralloluteibacterium stylophorae]